MPKLTKKLLVYLDQNFISEMAKAPINERVKPEFSEIYELLHKGFVEEKLVVPQSLMHDVETSMAAHYKERIVSYQNYLGQVRLYRSEEVANRQTDAALERFRGDSTVEVLKIRNAFLQDPDKRVEQLNITVDAHLETRDFRSGRARTGERLEALRKRRIQEELSSMRNFRSSTMIIEISTSKKWPEIFLRASRTWIKTCLHSQTAASSRMCLPSTSPPSSMPPY